MSIKNSKTVTRPPGVSRVWYFLAYNMTQAKMFFLFAILMAASWSVSIVPQELHPDRYHMPILARPEFYFSIILTAASVVFLRFLRYRSRENWKRDKQKRDILTGGKRAK
jgi:hypothetical protein